MELQQRQSVRSAYQQLENSDLVAKLRQYLENQENEVIGLLYFKEMSISEAAYTLNITEGEVETSKYMAIFRMAKMARHIL